MTSSRLLRGVFFLGHPLPTAMTAIATAAFFMMARRNMQVTADTAVMFTSVLLIQYSIGCMNDYVDEPLDRLAQRDEKPLVSGDVPKTVALFLWVFAALSGFAASAYFNLAAAGMAVVLWLAGVTYNFWAKRTALSWLPFVVFFPSLPVWSFIAAGRFTPALLLSYPIGALLSVGLNVANTLPDLDRDLEAGLKGLTHRLGRNRATRRVVAAARLRDRVHGAVAARHQCPPHYFDARLGRRRFAPGADDCGLARCAVAGEPAANLLLKCRELADPGVHLDRELTLKRARQSLQQPRRASLYR